MVNMLDYTRDFSNENTYVKATAKVAAFAVGMGLVANVSAAILEEIIVTAQKRDQDLMDVPISVATMDGETLQEKGLVNLEAVSASIPTLHIGEAQIGSQIFLRGIGSGVNAGFEQSVGTYVDGIYFGRGRQSRGTLFDVQRIEVLKGPQGTLFGKNTIAGALNITTAGPTEEFEGSASALYEFENEETILSGIVSGPLSDNISARLAVQWSDINAGWIQNDFRGGAKEPSGETALARLSVNWDVNDDLDLKFKYTYNDFDQNGRNSELSDPNGKYPGAPFVGLMADLVAPFGEFGIIDEVRNVGGTPGSLFDRDISNNESNSFVLTANYSSGEHVLTSITGYTDYELFDAQDADVTPLDIIALQTEEDYKQFSQELRLSSPGGETIDYIIGAYYQHDELTTSQMINVDLLDISVHPMFGIVGPPIFSARLASMEQDTTSWALFTQLTWNINEAFRTTIGLRYANDEKKAVQQLRLTEFGNPNSSLSMLFPPASGVVPGAVQVGIWGGNLGTFEHLINDKIDKSNFTPAINLQWDVNENAMAYGSITTGYKGAGFDAFFGRAQGEFSTSPPGFSFDQEDVIAYEIGSKMSLLEGAAELNFAVFYNDFDQVQVSTFDGGLSLRTGNAAKTVVKGVEVDGRWLLTDNFTASAALAYVDATYDEFQGAQCYFGQSPTECTIDPLTGFPGQDLSGKDLQFAPKWNGHLTLEHVMALSSFQFRSTLDLNYSDKYAIAADLDPRSFQDSFTKLDLRLALTNNARSWEAALIGRNLTNESSSTWANDTALAAGGFYRHMDRLRTIAFQVNFRF